jgi:hypothetical protein
MPGTGALVADHLDESLDIPSSFFGGSDGLKSALDLQLGQIAHLTMFSPTKSNSNRFIKEEDIRI